MFPIASPGLLRTPSSGESGLQAPGCHWPGAVSAHRHAQGPCSARDKASPQAIHSNARCFSLLFIAVTQYLGKKLKGKNYFFWLRVSEAPRQKHRGGKARQREMLNSRQPRSRERGNSPVLMRKGPGTRQSPWSFSHAHPDTPKTMLC